MSEARLSRLQKWILEELYIEWQRISAIKPDRHFWRSWIFARASEDGLFKKPKRRANEVIFSRSMWRLIEAGYLGAEGPGSPESLMFRYGKRGVSLEEAKANLGKDMEENFFVSMSTPVVMKSRRNFIQAKLIRLTEKGKERAKRLLSVKESLNVNKDKLTISDKICSEPVDTSSIARRAEVAEAQRDPGTGFPDNSGLTPVRRGKR